MKIALFVGSFDPVTLAHQEIARDLIKEKIVDFIYFIPVNSKKINGLNIEKRIKLLNLIITENQDTLNIYNYSKDGLFNYKVLIDITKDKNITHLIMGSDLFIKFNTFDNYQDILNKYYLIIINRLDDIKTYLSSIKVNQEKIIVINKLYLGSSSVAKQELKQNKNNYLNKLVLDYIKENNFYN